MRRPVSLLTMLFALSCAAQVVAAQPACPARPSKANVARQLASTWWRFGISFFEAKDYAKAIHAWKCANSLVPNALALYNIARAADRAGKARLSIRYYRRFLEARPHTPKRPEVEARIRLLKKATRRPPPRVIPRVAPRRRVRAVALDPPKGPAPAARASRAKRVVGWVMIGAGLALSAASGALGGLAIKEVGAVEDAPPGTPWSPDVVEHDKRFRLYRAGAWVCAGLAVATAATGVVLLILGRRSKAERATVTPVILTGGAGVSASLRF